MKEDLRKSFLKEVFFEFTRIGNFIKVTVIDGTSGTEVSFIGSALVSIEELKRIGLDKLEYVLKKKGVIRGKE